MGRIRASLARWLRLAAAVAIAGGAGALAQPGAAPLTALVTIRPGLWQIRVLGTGGPPRQRLCIADPAALVQVRHGAMLCSRFVIADDARDATIHYSCPGAGWGRTSLHVESDEFVHIETQGIADNAPFAFKAEARRVGPCGPAHGSPAR